MPGLVPGIHVFGTVIHRDAWMAGTGPAMTSSMDTPVAASRTGW